MPTPTHLDHLVESISARATEIRYSTAADKRRQSCKRPQELVEAEEKRRSATTVENKRTWRRIAQHISRKLFSKIAIHTVSLKRSANAVKRLRCEGSLTCDRLAWGLELTRYCKTKDTDQGVDDFWVCTFRDRLQQCRLSNRGNVIWNLHVTLAARAKLPLGKSAGGGDIIVPEMLLHLPALVCHTIHDFPGSPMLATTVPTLAASRLPHRTLIMGMNFAAHKDPDPG